MRELDKPLELGQKVKIGDNEYSVIQPAATIYNSWEKVGRPLPFVYVYLEDKDGKKVSIHVTEIAQVLDSHSSSPEST